MTLQQGRALAVPSLGIVIAWSVGCLAYWIHMLTAFAAFHDWSHQRAVEFTADETERVLGFRNGQGVWANYVFALVWLLDCGRLARAYAKNTATSRRLNAVLACIFAVIVFSATVVFGPPIYGLLCLPIATVWIWQWRRARHGQSATSDVG